MKNIKYILQEKLCTGCGTCRLICPVHAIVMQSDEEGFSAPVINEARCMGCGKCMNACPQNNPVGRHHVSDGRHYIARAKEYKEVRKSASGGMFYMTARYVIEEKGGVVFGARFNRNNKLVHDYTDRTENLRPFQNSKYVQSDVGDAYRKVKAFLEQGKYVFFSGTPCQVAGLYRFLNKDDVRLLTADLICHGVPSPELLQRQTDGESHTWKGSVKKIYFRYKNPLFKSTSSFYMVMRMRRGLPVVRRPPDDPFFHIFSQGIGFREACYRCMYADVNRVGDFTFGDCDSHRFYPAFHPREANSTLMLNSEKAFKIWTEALSNRCDYAQLDIEKERKCNKQLYAPAVRPDERDEIYKDLALLKWDEFASKYADRQNFVRKIRAYAALLLPPFITDLCQKRGK